MGTVTLSGLITELATRVIGSVTNWLTSVFLLYRLTPICARLSRAFVPLCLSVLTAIPRDWHLCDRTAQQVALKSQLSLLRWSRYKLKVLLTHQIRGCLRYLQPRAQRTLMSLRIAIVQFSPKIGNVDANLDTATKLCSQIKPRSVDLVCLPEMILTGYVFPSAAAITPHLEVPQAGPTSLFCAGLAKRLECYVAAGYPERLDPAEESGPVLSGDRDNNGEPVREVGANSAILYGPGGRFIGNYRKTNPYETDMTWAKSGTGFAIHSLPHPLHSMALGICMDLNTQPPAEWTFEDGPYEIADFCIEKKANILLLLNSWLDSGEEPDEDRDWSTLNYWAARLRPLWARTEALALEEDESSDNDSVSDTNDDEDGNIEYGAQQRGNHRIGQETIVIICNRCGEENGKTFAGSSAAFSLVRGSGRPRLLHAMGRKAEGVAVWTI